MDDGGLRFGALAGTWQDLPNPRPTTGSGIPLHFLILPILLSLGWYSLLEKIDCENCACRSYLWCNSCSGRDFSWGLCDVSTFSRYSQKPFFFFITNIILSTARPAALDAGFELWFRPEHLLLNLSEAKLFSDKKQTSQARIWYLQLFAAALRVQLHALDLRLFILVILRNLRRWPPLSGATNLLSVKIKLRKSELMQSKTHLYIEA